MDPNLTIGSIAFGLHNLERMDKHPLGHLQSSRLPRSDILLLGALNSREALDYHNMSDFRDPIIGPSINVEANSNLQFCKLPRCLFLQLDNYVVEKKSRYLFAYLSLPVARGIFKTIALGFLMVRHTHQDIDATLVDFQRN